MQGSISSLGSPVHWGFMEHTLQPPIISNVGAIKCKIFFTQPRSVVRKPTMPFDSGCRTPYRKSLDLDQAFALAIAVTQVGERPGPQSLPDRGFEMPIGPDEPPA